LLWIVLATLAAFYAGLCALLYASQRHIVYPAPRLGRAPAQPLALVQVERGTPMMFSAPRGDGPVVVFFHGNGEQIADAAWLSGPCGRAGAGFAAIEYPGYGLAADGRAPSEPALLDAAERGLQWLVQRIGISRDRIVLAGHSLGTGVAVAMAERGWGTRVLLFSPYTSLPDVGARMFPFLPVRLLMQERYDSAARAPAVRVKVLILHGTEDEVIPVDLGQALAGHFPDAQFVPVHGAHHNDLWDRPEAQEAMRGFLVEAGGSANP
jgi:hypothetical protein